MSHSPTEPTVWAEPMSIRSYDVDFTRQATVVSLCRHFLEAAWNHAEALGVGFEHLGAQGKVWVLSRLRMEIEQPPVWGSALTLRTWPRPIKSVFAMRDFEMLPPAGARVAAGSSAWLVLDAVSRRPQRLHKLLPTLTALEERMALSRDPEKLPDDAEWDGALSVAVRYTDIDVNQHVNSSRYLGWILDAYPLEYFREHWARALEVNYMGETRGGETLTVRSRAVGPEDWAHSLVNAAGDEVCRARLEWARRAPV